LHVRALDDAAARVEPRHVNVHVRLKNPGMWIQWTTARQTYIASVSTSDLVQASCIEVKIFVRTMLLQPERQQPEVNL
jgi:hypothetical protein